MSNERDLEAPLLNGAEAAEGEENCLEAVTRYERAVHVKAGDCGEGEPTDEGALTNGHAAAASHKGCSDGGGICNLAVTAVGAGMLALPKAFASVGILLGVGLFIAVCFLTYFSSSIIIRWAHSLRKETYGEVIRARFGCTGARILQGSIIVHVAGVMIVYCIIIADMLVGVLLAVLVVPMLISRDLTVVARYSRLSVFMMLALAVSIAGLAALAVAQGKAAAVHVLPVPSAMGDGTPFDVVATVLTVISVACLAFTCQFNLIPVHKSLKNPELPNMLRITRLSIALCALLYITIALSGYVLFGKETEGDVLKNLTIKFVGGLLPHEFGVFFINAIVICNTFNLLCNFVLKVWAVRDNVAELALGVTACQLPLVHYYGLTYLLVALAYGLSIVIPSVYLLVSLVGSTACVTFSYIFPGLLVIKGDSRGVARAFAYGAVALAGVMACTAVYNTAIGNTDMA
ncbi:hypothetical protein N2152v2_006241 [Parachlorella kessleri]